MSIIIIVILILGTISWAVCGVLAYGVTTAYFQQHHYSVRRPVGGLAFAEAIIGPFGLLISLALGEWGYHGLQWHHETSDWILDRTITPQVMADPDATKDHPRKVGVVRG